MSTHLPSRQSGKGNNTSFGNVEDLRARLRTSELERSKLWNENSTLREMRENSERLQSVGVNYNEEGKFKSGRAQSYAVNNRWVKDSHTVDELSRRVDTLEAEKSYFQVLAEKLDRRVSQLEEEKRQLEEQVVSQDETESTRIIQQLRQELDECRAKLTRQQSESAENDRVRSLEGDVQDLKVIVRELSRRATSVSMEKSERPHSVSVASAPPKASVEVLQRIIFQQGQYIKALQDEIAVYCCSPESSVAVMDKMRDIVSCSRPEKPSKSPHSDAETDCRPSSKTEKKESSNRDEPEPLPPHTVEEEIDNSSKIFDISYCPFGFSEGVDSGNRKQVHFDDTLRQSDVIRLTDPGEVPDSCPNTPPPRRAVLLNGRPSDTDTLNSTRASEGEGNKENMV
ncbi:hypothetical protein, conserved [Angomonas deanei]|uniref:Uncharacterized protein n=1 Tax=Angomonas deanei TaxID=59799 RepID=A0A7G2CGQ3_9TRYP|nr:hypothetical protein, conserved [Angomonas deanei]